MLDLEPTNDEFNLAHALIRDPDLTIDDPYYLPLKDKLALYLSSGYKDKEIQAEFTLSSQELSSLQAKVPDGFWERHRNSTQKHVARKRALLLTSSPVDLSQTLSIVGRLDEEWSPKPTPTAPQVTYNITQYLGDASSPPTNFIDITNEHPNSTELRPERNALASSGPELSGSV